MQEAVPDAMQWLWQSQLPDCIPNVLTLYSTVILQKNSTKLIQMLCFYPVAIILKEPSDESECFYAHYMSE